MKALNKFLIISFFIFSIPSISFALPKCGKTFHNCTGSYTYKSGNKYVGDWINGQRTGKGIFTFVNGKKQEGVFKNNKFLYTKKLDKKTHSSTSSEWGKSSLCRMLKRLAEKDSTKYDWQLGIGSAKRFLNQYPNSDVKDCLAKAIKILASKDFTPKPKFIVLDAKEYNSSKDIGK